MIRTNKVKTMTRAAIFEKAEERKTLYISRFFRNDYVLQGLLKSAIAATCAFALGVGMWVIYHAEELMSEKRLEDLVAIGMKALTWYGVALVAFLLASLVVYNVRYSHAQKRLKGYRGSLRKLLKMYQEEDTAKERIL